MNIIKNVKTNRQYVEDYIEYIKSVQGYSERTVVSYSHDLERLCVFLDSENKTVCEMTYEDAKKFSLGLYDSKLSSATINRILSANRSFFHNLCESGIIVSSPFSRVSRAKQGRRIPSVLSDKELEMLLDSPVEDFTQLMEVTMFNLFYSTGCRLSELINVRIQDVDIPARRITVLGKGNKQRYVFLSDRAVHYLDAYIEQRSETVRRNNSETDLLLVNKKGKQLPLSTVHIIFDKYRVKLGITKKFTPHVFRHTFATNLLENNSDIRIVQTLLGHESIGTTQIYTHVTGKRLENVYNNSHPHSGKNRKEH